METVNQKARAPRSRPVSRNQVVLRGPRTRQGLENVQTGGSQADSRCEEQDFLRTKGEVLGNQTGGRAGKESLQVELLSK